MGYVYIFNNILIKFRIIPEEKVKIMSQSMEKYNKQMLRSFYLDALEFHTFS